MPETRMRFTGKITFHISDRTIQGKNQLGNRLCFTLYNIYTEKKGDVGSGAISGNGRK